jgi:hypothetical protein
MRKSTRRVPAKWGTWDGQSRVDSKLEAVFTDIKFRRSYSKVSVDVSRVSRGMSTVVSKTNSVIL